MEAPPKISRPEFPAGNARVDSVPVVPSRLSTSVSPNTGLVTSKIALGIPSVPVQTVYASPQVSRAHKPSLGCTLLARPEEGSPAVSERKHSFVSKTSLLSLKCAFCNRLRTTSKCFVCSQCGMSVHNRCVSLVTSPCSSAIKTADAPVVFVSANQKRRGLRQINLLTERVVCRGYLYKQSAYGDWNTRR